MPKIITDSQIFHAVMDTINNHGYFGATTKKIASTAKISEITLFRKYGNKKELVKKTISFFIKKTKLTEVAYYSGDIREDLLRFVRTYQNSAKKYGNFFSILFLEITRKPELYNLITEPKQIFLNFGKVIKRYQDENLLKEEHPLITLSALIAPLMNKGIFQKVLPNGEIPQLDPYDHVESFLNGRGLN